jgi:hypothetical protein
MSVLARLHCHLDDHALGNHSGDRGNQYTGGKRQVDNINLATDGGTSANYTLARLKRDRPDLDHPDHPLEVTLSLLIVAHAPRNDAPAHHLPRSGGAP